MEVKTLLYDVEVVNKNPKYRITKYNDEYLMIDFSKYLVNFISFNDELVNP